MKRLIYSIFLLFLSSLFATTTFGLSLNFTGTTPIDSSLPEGVLPIQIGIDALNMSQFIFYQDGTGYSMYDSGLVLMYNFDNVSELGENSTIVKDFSSYGNDGSIYGSPTWSNSGKYGGVYIFDGINDYIDMASTLDNLASVSQGSATAWVKLNAYGFYLLSAGDADTRSSYLFLSVLSDGMVRTVAYLDGPRYRYDLRTTSAISLNEWHYLVFVQNGIEPVLYVDGVMPPQTFFNSTDKGYWISDNPALDTFEIGNLDYYLGHIGYFNGLVDEVRMYNYALSSGEIQQLYQSNLSKYDTDKWLFTANIPTTGKESITVSGSATTGGISSYLSERTFGGSLSSYISGFEEYPWLDISTSNSRIQNNDREDVNLEYGKSYTMSIQYLQDLPIGTGNILNFFGGWTIPSSLGLGEIGSLEIYVKPYFDSKDNFVVE